MKTGTVMLALIGLIWWASRRTQAAPIVAPLPEPPSVSPGGEFVYSDSLFRTYPVPEAPAWLFVDYEVTITNIANVPGTRNLTFEYNRTSTFDGTLEQHITKKKTVTLQPGASAKWVIEKFDGIGRELRASAHVSDDYGDQSEYASLGR